MQLNSHCMQVHDREHGQRDVPRLQLPAPDRELLGHVPRRAAHLPQDADAVGLVRRGYELRATGYKLLTSYELQVTSYRYLERAAKTSFKLQVTSYELRVTRYELRVRSNEAAAHDQNRRRP